MKFTKRHLFGVTSAVITAFVAVIAIASPSSASNQYRGFSKTCGSKTVSGAMFVERNSPAEDRVTLDYIGVTGLAAGETVFATVRSENASYVWQYDAIVSTSVSNTRWDVSNPDWMTLGNYNGSARTKVQLLDGSGAVLCEWGLYESGMFDFPSNYKPLTPAVTLSSSIVKTPKA